MSDIDWFGETTGINKLTAQPVADVPQPVAATSPRAAPPPAQHPQSIDWFNETTGLDKIRPPVAQLSAPGDESQGWGDWVKTSIEGKHDPRYKDLPSIYSQFTDELKSPTATAALGGANDVAMADIVQKTLGDKFIRRFKDANGYDVFVTRGADGKPQAGYLNRPGLDTEDAWRGFYGAAPYVLGSGKIKALTKGIGLGADILLQGAGAAVTSVFGDVANTIQGSKQGIDFEKAGTTAALGAVAPPIERGVGALWRNFVTIPGLIDQSTGRLTANGIAAAREAGLDPADINPDLARNFAKSFAATGDPAQAATRAGLDQYGIPATRGQVSKDPYLLTQEEGMRRRLYGEDAQATILGFDKQQQDAIRYAALGDDGTGMRLGEMSTPVSVAPKAGIGEQINPGRQPGMFASDRAPATLGENIQGTLMNAREAARQQESALWDDSATGMGPTPGALQMLPDAINPKIADIPIDTVNTPVAAGMRDQLTAFMEGKPPATVSSPFKSAPVKTVDQMRRRLLVASQGATNGSDQTAAKALYDGFNEWISRAAQGKLLTGDPEGYLQLAKARGFTKEVRNIFEPQSADRTLSPAGKRIAQIMDETKADSGERVIQSLFGADGSLNANQGTVSALQNIKTALTRFASPEQATQAWNDIRLAAWSRLVTAKTGEMLGPTAIMNNLKSAMVGQQTLMKTLFTADELRQMRLFQNALTQVAYKPPNASGSGYAAASFIKDGLLKILDSFGVGTPTRAVLERSGIVNSWNAAAAKQAIRQVPRAAPPTLTPYIVGAGSADARGQTTPPVRNALIPMGPRNALAY